MSTLHSSSSASAAAAPEFTLVCQQTWVEYPLGLGVTGTEGTVELEVVGVVHEGSSQGEQDPLWYIHTYSCHPQCHLSHMIQNNVLGMLTYTSGYST